VEPSFADTVVSYLPSPLVAAGIGTGVFALLAAWAWSRRDRKWKKDVASIMPVASRNEAPPGEFPAPHAAPARPVTRPLSPQAPAPRQAAAEAFQQTAHIAPRDLVDAATEHAAVEATAAAQSAVDAPVVFDDTPASYELDSRPATTVDFLVGMDEKMPEDRVRRLQYMHERYPELKTNAISIDDADGVINAARLYYEEADKDNGRDKASELLTFAVEERPQEIRFWLAQFEIFRLENMVAEFTAMAGKFHVLFSHTAAWPKVRHVGHELDPGNPLFAAGGSPLLAGETRFDPIAENWLNAPMDFTSDALMSDLRLALLDDYGVSRADFESITARLTASAGAA
jgi:hypothetical protein